MKKYFFMPTICAVSIPPHPPPSPTKKKSCELCMSIMINSTIESVHLFFLLTSHSRIL